MQQSLCPAVETPPSCHPCIVSLEFTAKWVMSACSPSRKHLDSVGKHKLGVSFLLFLLLKVTRLFLSLALKKNVIVPNWTIGEHVWRADSATLDS